MIEQAGDSFAAEAAACDFSFEVTCEALPPFDGPSIETIVPVKAPYRKAYEPEVERLKQSTVLVARSSGSPLGYVALSRNWNGFGLVQDFAVDIRARRRGVGTHLMDAAVDWARANALPGLMLETQSNNVPACRFYARYGFELGGFDRHLYDVVHPGSLETALFWYLLFG